MVDSKIRSYVLEVLVTKAVPAGKIARRVQELTPGTYKYFGSARAGINARVNHHKLVAEGKRKGRHWHVDRLLARKHVKLVGHLLYPGQTECELFQKALGAKKGTPVRFFGSTDCKSGCGSHLLRVSTKASIHS